MNEDNLAHNKCYQLALEAAENIVEDSVLYFLDNKIQAQYNHWWNVLNNNQRWIYTHLDDPRCMLIDSNKQEQDEFEKIVWKFMFPPNVNGFHDRKPQGTWHNPQWISPQQTFNGVSVGTLSWNIKKSQWKLKTRNHYCRSIVLKKLPQLQFHDSTIQQNIIVHHIRHSCVSLVQWFIKFMPHANVL